MTPSFAGKIVHFSLIIFLTFFLQISGKNRRLHEKRDFSEVRGSLRETFQADDAGQLGYDGGVESGAALPVNQASQKCVDIPRNMTLCFGIGYGQMLLPNLMEHETIREANEQSQTWMPLANIKCHQHTRLFLCSLFAPICPMQQPQNAGLDSENSAHELMLADQANVLAAGPVILPCRSLCESVKLGCQGVMSKHGFPWPDMLNCARFPPDNDMCISPNPTPDTGSANPKGDFMEEITPLPTTTTRASTTTKPTSKLLRTRRPIAHKVTPIATSFAPSTTPASANLSTPSSPTSHSSPAHCSMCTFVAQPAEMDAAFCQAEFVGKVRFRRLTKRGSFLVKRPKIVKLNRKPTKAHLNQTVLEDELRNAKTVEFLFDPRKASAGCQRLCGEKVELRSQLYFVMGSFLETRAGSVNKAAFAPLPQIGIQLILPWFSGQNSRDFRQAEKRLQNVKCSGVGGRPENGNLHGGSHKKVSKRKRLKSPL